MTLDAFIQETTDLAEKIEGLAHHLRHGRFLFAFRIVADFQRPTLHSFLETMREAERGWSNGPVFATEFCDHRPIENTDRNAVECQISGSRIHGYWRAVPEGMGVFLRDYLEDNDARNQNFPPAQIIHPALPIQIAGQCLQYVKQLGERLAGRAASLECRFDWNGIQGRKYDSSYATTDLEQYYGHTAVTKNHVQSSLTVTTAELAERLAAAALIAAKPLYDALIFDLDESYVKKHLLSA